MPLDTPKNRGMVADLGCIVCLEHYGKKTPANIHHVRRGGGKRANAHIIPLCPHHHQHGGKGEAIHAGRESWEELWGTEIGYVQIVEELIL